MAKLPDGTYTSKKNYGKGISVKITLSGSQARVTIKFPEGTTPETKARVGKEVMEDITKGHLKRK